MYDIQLYNGAGQTLGVSNFGPASVSGVDKVANRVVYALMTPAGSVPGNAAYGSNFASLVANFHSEHDVHVAFAASKGDVINSVTSSESEAEPDSDKLGDVRISSVSFVSDLVTIYLDVVAVDGSKPVVTPFIHIET